VFYDDLSLKKKFVTDSNPQFEPIASFDYGPSGEILQKNLAPASANPLIAAYSYDDLTRPTSIYYSLGSKYNPASPILQESLKYDEVGNVLQISDAVDLTNPGNIIGNVDTFLYDNLYRLKSANYVNDKAFTFNYKNLLGDRQDKTIISATTGATETTNYIDYGSDDRLKEFVVSGSAAAGSTSLNYDENGNVVSATGPSKNLRLKYDSLNRVTQSNDANDYSYDYQNLRVKKKTALGTTYYIYQGNNVIYEDFIPSGICQQTCGDLDGSGGKNVVDITYFVNYLFRGGPQPKYLCSADVNGNNNINVVDLTYYVNFLFRGGPQPICTSSPALSNDPTGGWTYERAQSFIGSAQTATG
ncbi:MAG: dockerin type I domain-containing protein, partial [Candidatus Micrarchaeota archaeon]